MSAISATPRSKLTGWIDNGGVLIRFAGTRLAASSDPLVPVTLQEGRAHARRRAVLGEAADSSERFRTIVRSPALRVPDATVTRQVLAEPDGDLPGKIWAALADGTPLVTAAKRGKGLVVLFHVTADTTWSNLPLSGGFVEMLRRIVALSGTAMQPRAGHSERGRRPSSPRRAAPSTERAPSRRRRQPHSPFAPTLQVSGDRSIRRASMVRRRGSSPSTRWPRTRSLAPIDLWRPGRRGVVLRGRAAARPGRAATDSCPAAADGRRPRRVHPRRRAGATAQAGEDLGAGPRRRPDPRRTWRGPWRKSAKPFEAALKTHLAYVVTGDKETDDTSLAGLKGLIRLHHRPHGAGAGRADRHRPGARRTRLPSADLLADRRRSRAAAAGDHGQGRRLHEIRRDDHLRYARRTAARAGPRLDAGGRNPAEASRRPSTFPSWSRSRATMS